MVAFRYRTVGARRACSMRLLMAAALIGIVVGCGDGAPSLPDDVAAERTCALLVDYRNEVAATMNEGQRQVRADGLSPAEAFTPAIVGLVASTDALENGIAALGLDSDDDGQRALEDQLVEGAVAAGASWRDLLADVRAFPEPDVETTTDRLGQLFVASEKPIEQVKPKVQDDLGDHDLEAAFDDQESCRFVVVH